MVNEVYETTVDMSFGIIPIRHPSVIYTHFFTLVLDNFDYNNNTKEMYIHGKGTFRTSAEKCKFQNSKSCGKVCFTHAGRKK